MLGVAFAAGALLIILVVVSVYAVMVIRERDRLRKDLRRLREEHRDGPPGR